MASPCMTSSVYYDFVDRIMPHTHVWFDETVCSRGGQCPTINQMDVCGKLNMKYNARVFLPVRAKGTSEVTQTAQFILRGLRKSPMLPP